MSSIIVAGDTSGSVTISAPAVAGTPTLTLPTTSGTVVTDSATQTLTNKTLTSPTITGALISSMASSVITSGTAQASTSGTTITFTGIPSWAKRVTMIFSGVSLSGSDNFLVQVGSGSLTTSGYSCVTGYSGASTGTLTSSSGILIASGGNAGDATYGQIVFLYIGSNTWVATGSTTAGTSINYFCVPGGAVSLSGALDRIAISSSVSNTFDAGTINILYE